MLYRDSGLFLKRQPDEFIRVISEFDIEWRELKHMEIMLPYEEFGSIGQKLDKLKERIRLVQALADSNAKSKVLGILIEESGRLPGGVP